MIIIIIAEDPDARGGLGDHDAAQEGAPHAQRDGEPHRRH